MSGMSVPGAFNIGGFSALHTPSGVAVPVLPTVDTTNLVQRYQPDHSTVTLSGSEVLTATNIMNPGTMDLAAYAATRGAIQMTDTNPTSPGYGRKFWRFDSKQVMVWTGGSLSTTNMAVFFVMRALRGSRGWTAFSLGSLGAGNTNGGTMRCSTTGSLAPWLMNANVSANTVATGSGNAAKHIIGSQLQVAGFSSGAGAGNGRLYMNSDALVVAGPTAATFPDGQIGGYAHSALNFGTASTLGTCAEMDVYDILVYNVRPSSGVADSIAAALQAGYGISNITDSLVLDGDSITQGFYGDNDDAYKQWAGGCVTNGQWMDIPAGYRVLNVAQSGDQTSQLRARMIATNSAHSANAMIGGVLSGHNRVAFQIGVNDLIGGGRTPANVYNEAAVTNSIVNVIAEATNGYKNKYDKIFSVVNIATANAAEQLDVDGLRVYLRDIAQFRTDTGTTSANLDIIDLPEITFGSLGGVKYFNTSALANVASRGTLGTSAIYQDDGLHPSGSTNITHPGAEYQVKGGAWDGGSGDGLNVAFL